MPTRFITSIIKEWVLDEDQYKLQESKQILPLRWERRIYLDRNDKDSCSSIIGKFARTFVISVKIDFLFPSKKKDLFGFL
jgi:hypothetical protein